MNMVVVIPQSMSLSDFLSFLLFLPFRPCGAVYPRNMSQCPHEDGGAKARGAEPPGVYPNCARRGALSPQCREGARTVCTPPAGCGKQSRDYLTRLCAVFRPQSGQRRDARATKRHAWPGRCTARTAQQNLISRRAINGKNSKSVRQRLFCACKTITKGGVNLPFRV